jgi:alpha-tubulin suppressor-like RCC1 family protein
VLLVAGPVLCWGRNQNGELGHGNTSHTGDAPGEMPPVATNVGNGNVVQIRAGGYHTCVLLDNNKVRCWGLGWDGALGSGSTDRIGDQLNEMPPPDLNLGAGVITQLGVHYSGGCVLFDNGDLKCWGLNSQGELGQGTTESIGDEPGEMPPVVTNYGAGTIAQLHGAYGSFHILMEDGTVRNWGKGTSLGYGSVANIGDAPGEMPPNDVSLGGIVIALASDHTGSHSCAILQDWTVRCWGYGLQGQLGYVGIGILGDGPNEMPPAPLEAY